MIGVVRIYGSQTKSVCWCPKGSSSDEEHKRPAPWETAVLIAEAEVSDACSDIDLSKPGGEEKLLNCLIANIDEILDDLEQDELERLKSFRYIYIFVDREDMDWPLGRRAVQNPLYWKALYEQCKGELEALKGRAQASTPGEPSRDLKELLEELKKCHQDLKDCEVEKVKCESRAEVLKLQSEACQKEKAELLSKLIELTEDLKRFQKEVERIRAEKEQQSQKQGGASSHLDKALSKLSDNIDEVLREVLAVAKTYVEKQAEVQKIEASARSVEKLALIQERIQQQKQKAMTTTQIFSTLWQLGRKFGVLDDETFSSPFASPGYAPAGSFARSPAPVPALHQASQPIQPAQPAGQKPQEAVAKPKKVKKVSSLDSL